MNTMGYLPGLQIPGCIIGRKFSDAVYSRCRLPIVPAGLLPPVSLPKNTPARRGWTSTDVEILTDAYRDKIPLVILAAKLGRTVGAVGAKAYRLGLRRRRKTEQVELIAPLALPIFDLKRTKGGRMVWNETAVRAVARLWLQGFDHKCIGCVLDSTPGSVRSIASRRGMPDRSGYTLRHAYDSAATPLDGLAECMHEKFCKGTGALFFMNRKDRANAWYSPAFKASKKYKASFGE